MAEASGTELGQVVALLATAVVAVPIFRKLGLGSVLGYLAAGLLIGPFGLRLFTDPEAILHTAELGVVMLLFIIGLEMRPKKLWSLRKEIFGLGLAQVAAATGLLTLLGVVFGLPPVVALIAGAGFVLSSTAVIMQMLDERGELLEPQGQRAVSILLLEDLAIVPLLALVAFLGAAAGNADAETARPLWMTIATGLGVILAVVLAGRYLLNPLFRILANTGAREVMTAAALLVVLGAAWFMDLGGLSMAMGAFLAGVLLSDSTFRHQLEADVEPFRAILLGLFFLSVGMSLDVSVVVGAWQVILLWLAGFMAVKAVAIYGVARLFRAAHNEALERAALFAQGGEFAFVLYGAALAVGIFDPRVSAMMTAVVILSMAFTPLVTLFVTRFLLRDKPVSIDDIDGVERAEGLRERVLVIGFGRFAQVASQALLARDVDVSIIDSDVEMIQAAGNFGFKIYYGDGSRLDVLRASGAATAEAILVCVDKPEVSDRIVELARSEFPLARLYVRAFDRGHSLRLVAAGVDYELRETFESALRFGGKVLSDLGLSEEEVAETVADVRRRDEERFEAQLTGGLAAGRSLLRSNMVTPEPEPYMPPKREAQALNQETAVVLEEDQVREEAAR
ncbi:monovalent cation:proton antiporter-2 (CPA2) family protein [Brevundimonas sp.]|uniref:monovalent cation:proton antiporter-2 (CPA2) family protein n=1 Tax=Brevundimonas sp. TaxID=1871086 RepID=UPI0025DEF417|nr:monovalent cation:proton antiporter-2 (CPA2) family protein [Brevundimonas sp.]